MRVGSRDQAEPEKWMSGGERKSGATKASDAPKSFRVSSASAVTRLTLTCHNFCLHLLSLHQSVRSRICVSGGRTSAPSPLLPHRLWHQPAAAIIRSTRLRSFALLCFASCSSVACSPR